MSMTCKELFEGLECTILGNEDEVVTGIANSSNKVKPGDAFCCIVGLKSDGHTYAQDAINRGAHVLVAERPLVLADASDVTLVIVEDSRKAMAHISARFHGNASASFSLVGVTGTNGKTTTTYLVDHIAQVMGQRTGLIGTVCTVIDGQRHHSDRTTPESTELQELFGEMRDAGCGVVTMEVSSHALDLERTWGSTFAVTAFTNLTQDHLDYHRTFEAYFEAKARLFSKDYPAKRVISVDSSYGQELLARCSRNGDSVITTGFAPQAQIHPRSVEYGSASTTVTFDVKGQDITFTYPLVGKFNVENVMTAFGIGLQLGYSANEVASALKDAPAVPGRVQRVHAKNDGDVRVYVDYAHTPDALTKAISSVSALSDGKTIVVFGCGGDRDSSKRPIMGRAALAADHAVVTSDNPRTEDPQAIIDDILPGMVGAEGRYEVEPDRASAIKAAIKQAKPGDVVLIAGKGHENYQLVGSETLHFDDVEVATAVLDEIYG